MSNAPRSVFGFKPTFSSSTVEGLENVDTNSKSDGDILAYVASTDKWTATANSATTAPIVSIGGLTTAGNEMLYTTSSDVYATTPITSAGRSFVSAGSPADQRSNIGAVIGTDVQAYSSSLSSVDTISGIADQIPYSTGSGYSNTPVSSYVRSSILNAANASAIATAIGGLSGSASTTSSVMRVTASNTLSESGVQIDGSDNLTGVNDASFGGDLTVTGTINVAGSNAFAQIANIGAETINATQWGYVGASDQGTATTDTPTFVGANMGSARVTAVADPTSATDAATKSYVDTVAASGAAPFERVQLATAASLGGSAFYTSTAQTLTSIGGPGLLSVDGVATANGNRILVKDQSPNTMNGIYDVTDNGATPGPNWVLTRSSDFNQAAMPISAGAQVFVEINAGAGANSGTTEAVKATVSNVDPLTDAVEFVQTSGTQTLAAGSGIDATQLAGGTVQTDISARLKYTGNTIDLNTVDVAHGGTGTTTLGSGNVLLGAGTSAITSTKAAPTGDFIGTTDSQTLTNKVATSNTNNITARGVFSGSGAGTVSTYAATAPTSGQVLTAVSGTVATWQTPATVSPAAFEPDRTLFVFQSATDSRPDWSTVAGAITDASALTPTAADPVIIFVYPGTYAESTPLTVPAYVTISAMTDTQAGVIIRPTAPAAASAVMRVGGNARINGILIDGFDGASAYSTIGVESFIGTAFALDYLSAVTARNCTTACFQVSGNGAQYSKILSCKSTSALITVAFPFTCGAGYRADNAGLLVGTDLTASGFLSSGAIMEKGIYVLNDYSYADVVNVQLTSATAGLVIGGGTTSNSLELYPHARITTMRMGFISDNAVQLDAKAKADLFGLILTDDTGIYPNQLDLYITNPSSPADRNFLEYHNCQTHINKISILNGASNNETEIVGTVASDETNDHQFFTLGSLVVGAPFDGKELVCGEGNSHAINMVVKEDDGGVFSTVTDNVNNVTLVARSDDVATTGAIDLASAPATIDGVTPVSGVTRVLVKDGSTGNPGTTSIDNGVYTWNGTGAAMTRVSDFDTGQQIYYETEYRTSSGATYTGARHDIDSVTFSGTVITVGTTAFGFKAVYTNPFPLSPANDDAFYVGSDRPLQFPGLKIVCESSLVVSSGDADDTFIWEFWNGSAWTSFTVMVTDANAPFTHRSNEAWGLNDARVNNPGGVDYQIRFGDMTGWATTTVDGVAGYWVRCRLVDVTNITQVPSIGRLKLHTNRTEINKNGFVEFFGASRPNDVLSYSARELIDPGNGSGFTRPGAQRITPESTGFMSFDVDQTEFGAAADTAAGQVLRLPHGIDTSYPVVFVFEYATAASTAGDIGLSLSVVATDTTDTIGIPAGTATAVMKDSGVVPVTVSGTAGTVERYAFEVDVSDYFTNSSSLWAMFVRNGSDVADTYGSSIYMYNMSIHYTKWCIGATGTDHNV